LKALIVTADDFGISRNINEAVVRAFREGILTSASLVVGGSAFEHAVELARDNNFSHNPTRAGLKYFFRASTLKDIRDELGAQIEKFLSTGLPLDFINGHLNIHVHPRVFDIILELTDGLEMKNFRLPREDLLRTLKCDMSGPASKLFNYVTFTLLSRRCAKALREKGFCFTDRVYGLLQSGDMNAGYVASLMGNLPEGTSEMYFHPCIMPCDEYSRWMPDYHPEEEFDVLVNKDISELLQAGSVHLTNYTTLERKD
jgi:predicted glycoside hydrolase/deacetylase ChbG (UPF0249 family)